MAIGQAGNLVSFSPDSMSSFCEHRSQKRQKDSKVMALSGSLRTKAAHKILVKLTPSVNITNKVKIKFQAISMMFLRCKLLVISREPYW